MKTYLHAALAAALILTASCKMDNPLLTESPLPYGAPQFDKIKTEHYMPAFKEGIARAKAEIDAIVANPDEPDFANTIEALEFSGETLNNVSSIFYNLLEADATPELQAIAEEISPMMTEYSMYVSLNEGLFERIRSVWDRRDSLGLEPDQLRLLDETYKSFARNGANLSPEDKQTYSKYQEELSLLSLKFNNNALASTNAYKLNLTDEEQLEGLPQYVRDMGAATAKDSGQQGWTFDLSYPSYSAFMKFSARPELRKQMYMAYNSIAFGGEYDNSEICLKIADLRLKTAQLLGYETYADYVVEDRMAENVENVYNLLDELLEPSLPAARKEVARIYDYARENGYGESAIQPWDFSYWSEKYKASRFSLSDEQLKPYFRLESCIDAVFGLATRLYGLQFTLRDDIPGYHKDVKVYDVCDADGRHLALFYADFFPRATKRNGAWMTSFRGQSIRDGVERRPLVSIVTNFSKPTADAPSLLTHYELTTFLHEFGHSLQGMMAEGRYPSQTGTSVAWDFVELPSQIMENWAYEPEYLKPFAKHYETGEEIPDELIEKISESKNYNVAYAQVRQLQFGFLDMAWHDTDKPLEGSASEIEKKATAPVLVLPDAEGTCMSTSFSHIFSGGYSAGYYSYKWAEVLAADAWSLFKEKGIFSKEVASSFRENILSKGDTEPAAVLYRKFRGHDPEPEALLRAQGIE
ncbi:MAG TPA: M3 family metallopeptidase [Candidatus Cryptobacteroides excrementigallinarum]|nr:M3 family metallopeptidase [Candidatus Cryptobacteroides excrementigallinarum]